MLIRQATAADIDPIMALIRQVVPLMRATGNLQWDSTYPNPKAFAADIAKAQLWVAVIDDRLDQELTRPDRDLAAVAALTTDQEPEYADAGWDTTEPAIVIHRLAVHPDHQRKGLAVALIAHAERLATERGLATVRLDTNTQNLATQRLLPRLGYRFCGEIGLHFRPGLRFSCYEKRLG